MRRSANMLCRPGLTLAAVLASFASGCGAASPAAPHAPTPAPPPSAPMCEGGDFGAPASLVLDRAALLEAGTKPELLARVDESAYKYFRLLARPFEARTCWALRDVRWSLPEVVVHGDAHLEQFVVTHDTFGLEDFDRAGYGPAVVDLVRYAASLHLACRQLGPFCDPDAAIEAHFDAYRAAIDRAPDRTTTPHLVEALRARSPRTRRAWLDWAENLMSPLPADVESKARAGWSRFVALQLDVAPERPASFYEIERLGSLTMGVGSAAERKYLVRVRGATHDPADDVILEARAGDTSGGTGCVPRPLHGGSIRVLMFTAILGSRMPDVFGFVPVDTGPDAQAFWVHAWDPGYTELSVGDVSTQEQLEEIAVDAAKQLAGHFWRGFPEPLRGHQRHAQLLAFDATRSRAVALARELADETVRAWSTFRSTRLRSEGSGRRPR